MFLNSFSTNGVGSYDKEQLFSDSGKDDGKPKSWSVMSDSEKKLSISDLDTNQYQGGIYRDDRKTEISPAEEVNNYINPGFNSGNDDAVEVLSGPQRVRRDMDDSEEDRGIGRGFRADISHYYNEFRREVEASSNELTYRIEQFASSLKTYLKIIQPNQKVEDNLVYCSGNNTGYRDEAVSLFTDNLTGYFQNEIGEEGGDGIFAEYSQKLEGDLSGIESRPGFYRQTQKQKKNIRTQISDSLKDGDQLINDKKVELNSVFLQTLKNVESLKLKSGGLEINGNLRFHERSSSEEVPDNGAKARFDGQVTKLNQRLNKKVSEAQQILSTLIKDMEVYLDRFEEQIQQYIRECKGLLSVRGFTGQASWESFNKRFSEIIIEITELLANEKTKAGDWLGNHDDSSEELRQEGGGHITEEAVKETIDFWGKQALDTINCRVKTVYDRQFKERYEKAYDGILQVNAQQCEATSAVGQATAAPATTTQVTTKKEALTTNDDIGSPPFSTGPQFSTSSLSTGDLTTGLATRASATTTAETLILDDQIINDVKNRFDRQLSCLEADLEVKYEAAICLVHQKTEFMVENLKDLKQILETPFQKGVYGFFVGLVEKSHGYVDPEVKKNIVDHYLAGIDRASKEEVSTINYQMIKDELGADLLRKDQDLLKLQERVQNLKGDPADQWKDIFTQAAYQVSQIPAEEMDDSTKETLFFTIGQEYSHYFSKLAGKVDQMDKKISREITRVYKDKVKELYNEVRNLYSGVYPEVQSEAIVHDRGEESAGHQVTSLSDNLNRRSSIPPSSGTISDSTLQANLQVSSFSEQKTADEVLQEIKEIKQDFRKAVKGNIKNMQAFLKQYVDSYQRYNAAVSSKPASPSSVEFSDDTVTIFKNILSWDFWAKEQNLTLELAKQIEKGEQYTEGLDFSGFSDIKTLEVKSESIKLQQTFLQLEGEFHQKLEELSQQTISQIDSISSDQAESNTNTTTAMPENDKTLPVVQNMQEAFSEKIKDLHRYIDNLVMGIQSQLVSFIDNKNAAGVRKFFPESTGGISGSILPFIESDKQQARREAEKILLQGVNEKTTVQVNKEVNRQINELDVWSRVIETKLEQSKDFTHREIGNYKLVQQQQCLANDLAVKTELIPYWTARSQTEITGYLESLEDILELSPGLIHSGFNGVFYFLKAQIPSVPLTTDATDAPNPAGQPATASQQPTEMAEMIIPPDEPESLPEFNQAVRVMDSQIQHDFVDIMTCGNAGLVNDTVIYQKNATAAVADLQNAIKIATEDAEKNGGVQKHYADLKEAYERHLSRNNVPDDRTDLSTRYVPGCRENTIQTDNTVTPPVIMSTASVQSPDVPDITGTELPPSGNDEIYHLAFKVYASWVVRHLDYLEGDTSVRLEHFSSEHSSWADRVNFLSGEPDAWTPDVGVQTYQSLNSLRDKYLEILSRYKDDMEQRSKSAALLEIKTLEAFFTVATRDCSASELASLKQKIETEANKVREQHKWFNNKISETIADCVDTVLTQVGTLQKVLLETFPDADSAGRRRTADKLQLLSEHYATSGASSHKGLLLDGKQRLVDGARYIARGLYQLFSNPFSFLAVHHNKGAEGYICEPVPDQNLVNNKDNDVCIVTANGFSALPAAGNLPVPLISAEDLSGPASPVGGVTRMPGISGSTGMAMVAIANYCTDQDYQVPGTIDAQTIDQAQPMKRVVDGALLANRIYQETHDFLVDLMAKEIIPDRGWQPDDLLCMAVLLTEKTTTDSVPVVKFTEELLNSRVFARQRAENIVQRDLQGNLRIRSSDLPEKDHLCYNPENGQVAGASYPREFLRSMIRAMASRVVNQPSGAGHDQSVRLDQSGDDQAIRAALPGISADDRVIIQQAWQLLRARGAVPDSQATIQIQQLYQGLEGLRSEAADHPESSGLPAGLAELLQVGKVRAARRAFEALSASDQLAAIEALVKLPDPAGLDQSGSFLKEVRRLLADQIVRVDSQGAATGPRVSTGDGGQENWQAAINQHWQQVQAARTSQKAWQLFAYQYDLKHNSHRQIIDTAQLISDISRARPGAGVDENWQLALHIRDLLPGRSLYQQSAEPAFERLLLPVHFPHGAYNDQIVARMVAEYGRIKSLVTENYPNYFSGQSATPDAEYLERMENDINHVARQCLKAKGVRKPLINGKAVVPVTRANVVRQELLREKNEQ